MGLLDWFGKQRPQGFLSEISEKIAYTLVPRLMFKDFERLRGMYQGNTAEIGPRFYAKVCEKADLAPVAEDAQQIRGSHGFWDQGREYFALEFPPPRVRKKLVRRPDDEPESWPRLSLVVLEPDATYVRSLVLAELADGTTRIEEVTPDETFDLGPGPEPQLSAFLEFLAEQRPWRTV